MPGTVRIPLATTHIAVVALCWVGGAAADETVAVRTPGTPTEPSVTILQPRHVLSILGKEARSSANENMGRIIDVIVDRAGRVRAAVIDFGGFLGVGSRKIAVDWSALSFPPANEKAGRVTLGFTRDQVKAGPEFQAGKPVVVLGAQGKLEPFPYQ